MERMKFFVGFNADRKSRFILNTSSINQDEISDLMIEIISQSLPTFVIKDFTSQTN